MGKSKAASQLRTATTARSKAKPLGKTAQEHVVHYQAMLDEIDNQMANFDNLKRGELQQLETDEEACFQRFCNRYTIAQLNMTIRDFELLEERHEEEHNAAMAELDSTVDHVVFKLPARAKLRPPVLRRSSFARAVPRISFRPRTVPKLITSGIKNVEPRQGRPGEVVYSATGSPILIGNPQQPSIRGRKKHGTTPAVAPLELYTEGGDSVDV